MDCQQDTSVIISTIVASGLLVLSELLPFATKIKSNGIIQAIFSLLSDQIKKKETISLPI